MDGRKVATEGKADAKVRPAWAAVPATQGHLILVSNEAEGKTDRHILDDKACYILGRDKNTCDFTASSKTISRCHCQLVHAGEVRLAAAAVLCFASPVYLPHALFQAPGLPSVPLLSEFSAWCGPSQHRSFATTLPGLACRPQSVHPAVVWYPHCLPLTVNSSGLVCVQGELLLINFGPGAPRCPCIGLVALLLHACNRPGMCNVFIEGLRECFQHASNGSGPKQVLCCRIHSERASPGQAGHRVQAQCDG